MAGYSGTPLAKKLGIKEGAKVLLARAPKDFEATLEGLPPGVSISSTSRSKGPFDAIVAFVSSSSDVGATIELMASKLTPAGGLWISWPKGKHRSDPTVTENLIRDVGLKCADGSLVDNKVCAVSDEWSGLRFVRRVERRARGR